MSVDDEIQFERDGHVARVWLNRPWKKNCVTVPILKRLDEIVTEVDEDPDLRVLVLRGRGGTFCSGFDLGQRAGDEEKPRAGATQRRMRWQVNRLIPTMLETQTPIVTGVFTRRGAAWGSTGRWRITSWITAVR